MSALLHYLAELGTRSRAWVLGAGFQVNLLFQTTLQIPFALTKSRQILRQMYIGGVRSIPVVILVAMFAGMIVSFQTGIELARFGQEESIGSLTAITMCREMGPFITAIILAASVGAALAAELGTMAVSEEILALEVMSISPVRFLVMPRVIALALICPMLTIVTNLVGILGGGLVSQSQLGVDFTLYIHEAMDSLRPSGDWGTWPKDIYTGLFKSFVFGITIAVVSCGSGLRATHGAEGVGAATRTAVRNSIVLILIFGYLISWFLYR